MVSQLARAGRTDIVSDVFSGRFVRLTYRPTEVADLDVVVQMERHPDNASFIRHWSEEQHRTALMDDDTAHLMLHFEDRPVGYMILPGVNSPDRSWEFKRLAIVEKGIGLGREAVQLVKFIGFDRLEVHRIWLEAMVHNERALHLYESEGFVKEGVHREAVKQRESFVSLVVMSM